MGEDKALPRHSARKFKKDPARECLGFAACKDWSDEGPGSRGAQQNQEKQDLSGFRLQYQKTGRIREQT